MTAATTRSTGTGTSAGGIKDYTAVPQEAQTRTLSMQADYLRTQSDLVGGEV